MHNLAHAASITEEQATEIIFNACRGNADRAPFSDENGYGVTFMIHACGNEHSATLRDPSGTVVAHAVVDEFDC